MRMDRYFRSGVVFLLALGLIVGCQPTQVKSSQQATDQSEGTAAVEQSATPKPVQKAPISADAPQITIENPSHDFGQVGPGSNNKAEFRFSNTGKEKLVIDHVQSTCGCTVPELDKNEYAQGESGVITVAFQAPAIKGPVTKHLYVISNDPANPRAELEIKAEVAVKVEVSPDSVDLRLDKPNADMPEITVRSLDNKEFSIRSVTVGNNVMKMAFDPTQKATSFVLKPEVDMKLLDTYNNGAIQISTDHPQSGTLLVRYTCPKSIEPNRPRIILQNVEPGVPVLKDVLLRSNYDKPIEILSSESQNGYMQIASDEKDGNHRKLMIQITPPAQASTERRYITDALTIHLKSGETVTITCSGWYKL